MKIYYINLDDSVNRRSHMEKEFSKSGIKDAIRASAIDGTSLDTNKLRETGVIKMTQRDNTVACALSHVEVWSRIVESDYEMDEPIVIFEDDVIIPDDFQKKFDEYFAALPRDWNFVYLGGSRMRGYKINDLILKSAPTNSYNGGFYAYMITKHTAFSILKRMAIRPLDNMIDLYYRDNFRDLNTYMFYPPLIEHNFEMESVRYKEQFYSEKYLKHVKEHMVLQ